MWTIKTKHCHIENYEDEGIPLFGLPIAWK